MRLQNGDYELIFNDGGVVIEKAGSTLYYNKSPMYAFMILLRNLRAGLSHRE